MNCEEAIDLFEKYTKMKVEDIERCGVGIANYVFLISTQSEKFILRCSAEKDAYKESIRYLIMLSECGIPVPNVLEKGVYNGYEFVILTYIQGDDIGNVYHLLSDNEKKQIAKEVVEIQKKVSKLPCEVVKEWNWNNIVSDILNRASGRIDKNNYFDIKKVDTVRRIQDKMKEYFLAVTPKLYLDDISTKNLLISKGRVSGVIDIDWLGTGDMLTFVALTRVALLNMGYDTKYVDYLLDEIKPNKNEQKAFVFYCLMFCVDFMGERGMQFLDKIVPVNEEVVDRLNHIFEQLLMEWRHIDTVFRDGCRM